MPGRGTVGATNPPDSDLFSFLSSMHLSGHSGSTSSDNVIGTNSIEAVTTSSAAMVNFYHYMGKYQWLNFFNLLLS